jgi:hypothetical protein
VNNETLLRARNKLYPGVVRQLIRVLSPFFGRELEPETLADIARKTYPVINRSRSLAQNLAYQDYSRFVGGRKLVPKMQLNRFTAELWQGSIAKAAEDRSVLAVEMAEELALSGDFWTRDAEWGQRVDSANKDTRIWKVARVDFDPPSCPFCTLLNSRGAVYLSGEAALRTLHKGDQCSLVFVAKGETDYPGKASTDQAKALYKQAVKAAPTGSTDDILKALGELDSPDRQKGVVRKNARKAAEEAKASEITATKARLSRLEKLNPSSAAAQKYQADQLDLTHKILSALEAS